jgi:Ca-activated chloride channel family protein
MRTITGLSGTIVVLLAALPAGTQTPPNATPTPPTFAARVEVVRLDVYASRDGHPLSGLSADDFEVLDNGVPQRTFLESAGGPVHAILLLDTSGSVAGERLEHLRAAAHAFVNGLGTEDQATLLTFSHDVRLASAPSRDRAPLHRALDEARAGGGTALHDALFSGLQFADPARGRGVVLVFSDGDDRLSWLDPARLREAARRTEASVYAVTLPGVPAIPGRDTLAYLSETANAPSTTLGRRERPPDRPQVSRLSGAARPRGELPPLLRDLASDTGGQVWRAEDGAQLRTAFLQALAEVKSRYLLRFEPSVSGPGWHTLEVKLRSLKGDVRARKGYVAAAGA